MFKKALRILMAALFVFMIPLSAMASDISTDEQIYRLQDYYNAIDEYLDEMSVLDNAYVCCANSTYTLVCGLYNHSITDVTSLLFKIEKNGQYLGYVIVRVADQIILESALCDIPYKIPESGVYTMTDVKWVYDYANHGVSVDGQTPVYITDSAMQQSVRDGYFNFEAELQTTVSPQTVLRSVPVYLQNSYNCIVCAVSHLLLYWNNNGFSGLTPTTNTQAKFETLMDTVDGYFSSYANNNIPTALASYAVGRSTPLIDGNVYYVVGTNDWSPTYNKIKNEIAAGRPFLLGFAAGEGSYSTTVGHMTLCVGAASTNAELHYLKVVDGHSPSIVTKYWDADINDFICTVTVEQETIS